MEVPKSTARRTGRGDETERSHELTNNGENGGVGAQEGENMAGKQNERALNRAIRFYVPGVRPKSRNKTLVKDMACPVGGSLERRGVSTEACLVALSQTPKLCHFYDFDAAYYVAVTCHRTREVQLNAYF